LVTDPLQTRWEILPPDEKQGIRSFVVQMVLDQAETQAKQEDQILLGKLNTILVSIVKHEWMTTWTNFLSDICQTAYQSEAKCENILKILLLVSEEVFDFGKKNIVSEKRDQFKQIIYNEVNSLMELCEYVIMSAINSQNNLSQSLIRQCLKTFTEFITWLPNGYIFENNLVENILRHFIFPSVTRLDSIKLFTEVVQINLEEEEDPQIKAMYKERKCLLFCIFIECIVNTVKGRNLREEYQTLLQKRNTSGFETFCQQLCQAISAVL
jgi:exportin-1